MVVDAARAEVGAGHAAGGAAGPLDGGQEAPRDRAAVVGAVALRLPHVDLKKISCDVRCVNSPPWPQVARTRVHAT